MDAKIKNWMQSIFPTKADFLKIKTLANLFHLTDNFSSTEDIFFILYKKGYISSHNSKVEMVKECRESGIKQPIRTNIPFHITENGILLLNEDEQTQDNNQLKLDL